MKRPSVTWWTLPAAVVIAGSLAVVTAQQVNGTDARANQVDFVDISVASDPSAPQLVRVQSWLTMYSPVTRRHEVKFRPAPLSAPSKNEGATNRIDPSVESDSALLVPPRVSWASVPETTFGGMFRTGGAELGRPAYHYSPRADGVDDLPIHIWSTRSLATRWQAETAPLVTCDLANTGLGQLDGVVVHHLPAPLEEWLLAYGGRVFRPATRALDESPPPLEPGVPWTLSAATVRQRELSGFLTGTIQRRSSKKRSTGGSEYLLEQTPYDPLQRDPVYIARMLTFHEAAGGSEYTGLKNQSLQQLDLTPLLELDRAVLFGKMSAPGSGASVNGEPLQPTRQTTFVRIVLPVKKPEQRN